MRSLLGLITNDDLLTPRNPGGLHRAEMGHSLAQFDILDANKECVLKIEGPLCACNLCGDVDFEVKTKDGQTVGKISKQWSGLVKEAFTDADNFGIQFPMDLDVKIKACLLGAVFLIDFMFFEQTNNQDNQRTGVWQ